MVRGSSTPRADGIHAIDKTSKTVAAQRIPIRLSQERGKLVVVASAASLARGEVPVTVALRAIPAGELDE